MVTVDTLSTKFVLDTGGYTANAQKATQATNQFATAATKAAAAQKALTASMGKGSFGNPGSGKSNPFGKARVSSSKIAGSNPFENFSTGIDSLKSSASDAISAFAPLKSLVLGIAGVAAAGGAAGFALAKQAAEFDSLRQSLISVEGDAKKAGKALADLKELSKAPGLGFEEAVRGYTGLRNAGLTQDFAEKLIKEFANANARGGGNAETFGRILTQVRQASGRKFLAQEDLSPIGEAGIPINKILKDAFGTGDTEELKKRGIGAQEALEGIVRELSKLQRVAGGAQNEFDNAGDALKFAGVAAGEGINKSFLPLMTEFATAVSNLGEDGSITSAFSGAASNIAEIFTGAGGSIQDSLTDVLIGIETASAGFRNLTENTVGFAKGVGSFLDSPFFKAVQGLSPLGAAKNFWDSFAGVRKSNAAKLGQPQDDFDYSLGAENDRTGKRIRSEQQVKKEVAEMRAAGFKGYKGDWDKMSPQQKEEYKKTHGNQAGAPGMGGAGTPEKRAENLLERIAINTARMADSLDDATSGGGALSDARSSVKELSGVQGGYNRRFRRMGA